jgi:hypothetical protein
VVTTTATLDVVQVDPAPSDRVASDDGDSTGGVLGSDSTRVPAGNISAPAGPDEIGETGSAVNETNEVRNSMMGS